ncbi:hypothetical protein [Salinifilum ghardaiensis]
MRNTDRRRGGEVQWFSVVLHHRAIVIVLVQVPEVSTRPPGCQRCWPVPTWQAWWSPARPRAQHATAAQQIRRAIDDGTLGPRVSGTSRS